MERKVRKEKPMKFARLAVALMVCLPAVTSAQAPASADSFVNSGSPNGNYGDKDTLDIQSARTSLITFDLSPLPTGVGVARATLRLYVDSVNTAGAVDAYPLTASWTESAVTFNTLPALGSLAAGPTAVAASGAFVLVDVTALAEGWLDGSIPNHGLALALDGTTGRFSFQSKENVHPPELDVVLNGPAGPSGPQGPVGPAGPQGPPGTGGVQTTGDTMTGTLTLNPGNIQFATASNGAGGSILKSGALFLHDGGNFSNIFVGFGSGNLTMTGSQNMGTGAGVLSANTIGSQNTAAGYSALFANTSGSQNTAAGHSALAANTSGSLNTAAGYSALAGNMTGVTNTAIGAFALQYNTTGGDNTATGFASLHSNISGIANTAMGTNALGNNTNGQLNTAVGETALLHNTGGSNNVAIGFGAGSALTTGSLNIDIGNPGVAGESNTIRIGTAQAATYVAGIRAVDLGDALPVGVDSDGRLGTIPAQVGPAGPEGPAGPPGPAGQVGPAGGLRFVDAAGLVIGPVIGLNSTVLFVDNDAVSVGINRGGIVATETGKVPKAALQGLQVTELEFASSDCSGVPYYWAGDGPIMPSGVFGSVLYYVRSGPALDLTLLSYATINIDGTVAPCQMYGTPSDQSGLGVVASAQVPVVTPPIHVEP
jgi:hypothetical protein